MGVGFRLRVKQPLAQQVAVGLRVACGSAHAHEVSLVVAAHRTPTHFAFCHQGEARRTGRAIKLRQRIGVRVLVRNRAEARGNIAAGSVGAEDCVALKKAARHKCDALVVEGGGALDGLFDFCGLVCDGCGQRGLALLDAGDLRL